MRSLTISFILLPFIIFQVMADILTLRLQHPGTCSGMYWRGDPFTGAAAPNNSNWPKNGAILKGTGPHSAKGEDHFKVSEFQQAGTVGFVAVPEGTWMPYNQGGLLLHKT
jgi:hypothetical protein